MQLSGRSAEDVTALSVLQQTFGYERFRPGQEEGVNALLQGKDCIILIPTGGGKTIIYSIPTLMMNGISVVISPLLMLMHDQVLRLREKAINTTYINSLMTATEREQVIGNLARPDSEYKVLICGPEIILSDDIFKLLASLRKARRLSFIAVDEAHVIDTWGCDFRHHYQELISLRQLNVPVVALTGTATESTVSVMKQVLGMDSPLIVRVPFQRNNLHFEVIEKESGKASSIQQIIDLINERFMNMCGIVYCQTREECETLALELKNNNHRAIYYHGGTIDPEIKVKHTNDWLEGKFEIMASTNAFGMGIDKSDVRFVIHKSMPNSLEAMVQESGRAGRDNEIAHCVMFGRFDDRNFHLRNISKLDSEHTRQKRLASLNVISEYLLSKDTCRQRKICSHFDSSIDYDCGHCDNCTNETVLTEKDYTEIAQVTVKCLQHVIIFKDKPTTEELCNTLMGSKAAIILRNNLHQVLEYGYCKGKVKSKRLMEFLQYMIIKGFLKENLRSVDDRVRSVYISVGEV